MTNEEDIWIERYTEIAKDPYTWLHQARGLIYAANEVLIKEKGEPLKGVYRNVNIYMMLSSFAIENILKCIIIQKTPTVVNNGKLDESVLGHDLLKLFKNANINYPSSEEGLLNRLSHFAIQAGKYPIPKNWMIYKDSLSCTGTGKHHSIFMSSDLDTIVGIISKLQEELKRIGVDYDIYDMSYIYIKEGKPVFVKRRIHPHRFSAKPREKSSR